MDDDALDLDNLRNDTSRIHISGTHLATGCRIVARHSKQSVVHCGSLFVDLQANFLLISLCCSNMPSLDTPKDFDLTALSYVVKYRL